MNVLIFRWRLAGMSNISKIISLLTFPESGNDVNTTQQQHRHYIVAMAAGHKYKFLYLLKVENGY